MKNYIGIVLFMGLIMASCKPEPKSTINDTKSNTLSGTPNIPFTVTRTIPHRTDYFTEGLLVFNGKLLESTGSPEELPQSESVITEVDLTTGATNERVRLDRKKYFGEGVVVLDNRVYQVTYKNQTGFIYDAKTFKKQGEFKYANKEGWGMTTDGTHIIMSDGTNNLTYFLPPDMKVAKTITVTDDYSFTSYLNELEYVNGSIYANVWQTPIILKIDATTGKVQGRMDLTDLKRDADAGYPNSEFPNGIAFDSTSGKMYVTGKLWPKIYELKLE